MVRTSSVLNVLSRVTEWGVYVNHLSTTHLLTYSFQYCSNLVNQDFRVTGRILEVDRRNGGPW